MPSAHLSRRRAAAMLAASLGAPGLAWAVENAPEPPVSDIAGRPDALARLTAPVTINGRGPFRFVVDTGSNHSLIAGELADALGLPAGDPLMVNTVAGAALTPSVTAEALEVGDQRSRDVVLARAPRQAIGGVGLLGVDRLEGLRLTLDYRRQRIAIGRSGARAGDRLAFSVATDARAGRLALVGARVGGAPVAAFLDSGSEVTLGNLALRRRLEGTLRLLGEAPVVGATGLEAKGELAVLPTLRLGGLEVKRLPVLFADLHTFEVWGLADEPGLLVGANLLAMFDWVDLDLGRRLVLFRAMDTTPVRPGRLRRDGPDPYAVLRQAG